MYESLLNQTGGLFSELERLQQDIRQALGTAGQPSSIRAVASGSFPAINVGGTPTTVEIYAFVPGVDASTLDVQIDRGVLTLSGERKSARPEGEERATVYAAERFAGRFKRTVSLPDDIDPAKVSARCRDGVLHITAARREATLPRRIEIQ